MTGLLHGELIKLRMTRTALGFALTMLGLMLLSTLLQTLVGDPTTVQAKRDAVSAGGVIPTVLIIFGAVAATGEHRHGTITSTFLIAPDRVRATVAKLLAYAAAGALVGLAVQLVAFAIGVPLLAGQAGPDLSAGTLAGMLVETVVACGLATAVGVGVGALVRNQVAAVVGTLAYVFIVESVVGGFLPRVYPFLIGGALNSLTGFDIEHRTSPVVGGLLLAAWTVAFGAAAVLADRSRDVS
ncbi:MAG: ABC transporter permease [Solirubrobacteraceae bacterium]|nr:ABC transporter permease [Solirubrobacteraceae bacterium]